MSVATINHEFRLAARPRGLPGREVWSLTEAPVGDPPEGSVLVKTQYLSLDPAMRGWMNDVPSYAPPVELGAVMRAAGVGRVVASRYPGLAPGDEVSGFLGAQEYAVLKGTALTKIDPSVAPLTSYLNALGGIGLTAYFGLLEIGRPEPGQTVVVSGAAGAVGAIVGQVAKLKGCRVVGIAGGAAKCAYLVDELGFDASIDYKAQRVSEGLKEHCPRGIDVFFDNVGGETLDACLARLAMHARVVICGAISQYNSTAGVEGPKNYLSLLVKRARMEGFLVFDWVERYPEALRDLRPWIAEGKLKSREHVVEGFERFPEALQMLFKGENFGKLVLKVGDG